MNIPDFWTKIIKEKSDEEWSPGEIWYQLTNRREDERTISYAESHDQALVGDKTLIFRLADSDMYWHMARAQRNLNVDRAIALHKMIRLATAATMNGGYLNFMGNEFGHPEWIDFPREGNDWSYHYARRQWDLADNKDLLYHDLEQFDRAMIRLLRSEPSIKRAPLVQYWSEEMDKVLCFGRGDLFFVFNFNPSHSHVDYEITLPRGAYRVVLNTDSPEFGGFGNIDSSVAHNTMCLTLEGEQEERCVARLYLPARTALVLRRS